jgi:hypothetical protein
MGRHRGDLSGGLTEIADDYAEHIRTHVVEYLATGSQVGDGRRPLACNDYHSVYRRQYGLGGKTVYQRLGLNDHAIEGLREGVEQFDERIGGQDVGRIV